MFVDPLKKYVRHRDNVDDIYDLAEEQYQRIIREVKLRPDTELVFASFDVEPGQSKIVQRSNPYQAAEIVKLWIRHKSAFRFGSRLVQTYAKDGDPEYTYGDLKKAVFTVQYFTPWYVKLTNKIGGK